VALSNHAIAIIAWYIRAYKRQDWAGGLLWREEAIPNLSLIKQAKQVTRLGDTCSILPTFLCFLAETSTELAVLHTFPGHE
jgi:hypothetical protein